MIKLFKNLMIIVSVVCLSCFVFTTNYTYAVETDFENDDSLISTDSSFNEEVDGSASNVADNSSITSNTNSSNSTSNNSATNSNSTNSTDYTTDNTLDTTANITSVTTDNTSDGSLQLSDVLNFLKTFK